MARLTVELIRHAQTPGNLEGRYIGCTDEDLCPQGIERASRLAEGADEARVWLVSPLRRCLETACLAAGAGKEQVREMIGRKAPGEAYLQLLRVRCPQSRVLVERAFRECDFGLFENKNWQQMTGDRAYQSWIDSGGRSAFPGGEDPDEFRRRCVLAFDRWMRQMDREAADGDLIRLVVHGGTIMSIMDRFFPQEGKGFYDWHLPGCGMYRFCLTEGWPERCSLADRITPVSSGGPGERKEQGESE